MVRSKPAKTLRHWAKAKTAQPLPQFGAASRLVLYRLQQRAQAGGASASGGGGRKRSRWTAPADRSAGYRPHAHAPAPTGASSSGICREPALGPPGRDPSARPSSFKGPLVGAATAPAGPPWNKNGIWWAQGPLPAGQVPKATPKATAKPAPGSRKARPTSQPQRSWPQSQPQSPPDPPQKPQGMHWVQLEETAPLVESGFPSRALSLLTSSEQVYKISMYKSLAIYRKITGDSEDVDEVEIVHDTDWSVFPEIGDFLKSVYETEYSFSLAMHRRHNVWAVGVSGKKKTRESTARLGLAVSLASNLGPADYEALIKQYEGFGALCDAAGTAPQSLFEAQGEEEEEGEEETQGGEQVEEGLGWKEEEEGEEVWPVDERKTWPPRLRPRFFPSTKNSQEKGIATKLSRDLPMWITLKIEEFPSQIAGASPEALVLATDDCRRMTLCGQSAQILAYVLNTYFEEDAAVGYHDDNDWNLFPCVGAELKALASTEECIMVSHYGERGVWAVGVANKMTCRLAASRLALAASLAILAEEEGAEVDLEQFELFKDFVCLARDARESIAG